jgi:broad specificity phosphatase PhoE
MFAIRHGETAWSLSGQPPTGTTGNPDTIEEVRRILREVVAGQQGPLPSRDGR